MPSAEGEYAFVHLGVACIKRALNALNGWARSQTDGAA